MFVVMVECILRLITAFTVQKGPGDATGLGLQKRAMTESVQTRINKLWLRNYESRSSPFEPPFTVFVNDGFHDEARIKNIVPYVLMEPNKTWRVPNFLRSPDQEKESLFTVTSNNHGFRGKNFDKKKSKDEYRILLLGSYPAFGHGVNDQDTYATTLENCLNEDLAKNKKSKKNKVLVMNAGKQGGTAIMGYSFLKNEASEYQPDLLLWDYGWIELFLRKDVPVTSGERLNVREVGELGRKIRYFLYKNYWSYLSRAIIQKFYSFPVDVATEGWRQAMVATKAWVLENKLKTIFVRHNGVALPKEEYTRYDDNSNAFRFIDLQGALKIRRLTEDEKNEFWSQKNWIDEFSVSRQDIEKNEPYLMFNVDAIQLNKFAHKRVGEFICRKILDYKLIYE